MWSCVPVFASWVEICPGIFISWYVTGFRHATQAATEHEKFLYENRSLQTFYFRAEHDAGRVHRTSAGKTRGGDNRQPIWISGERKFVFATAGAASSNRVCRDDESEKVRISIELHSLHGLNRNMYVLLFFVFPVLAYWFLHRVPARFLLLPVSIVAAQELLLFLLPFFG